MITLTFDKGSLILVDYTATIKDTDEVIDTTFEHLATQHSIFKENTAYRPKLISIGEPAFPVMKGFDEGLAGMSVGDSLTIEVTPDKGLGNRDSGKVRMIPIRKLGEDADKVSVGDTIEIDNKKGIVRFVGSGRVQIDYNHKHAGKTILFNANVVESLDTPEAKIDAILKFRLAAAEELITFDLKDTELVIPFSAKIRNLEGIQTIKNIIQMNLFKFVPTLDKISFVETFLQNRTAQTDHSEAVTPPQSPLPG